MPTHTFLPAALVAVAALGLLGCAEAPQEDRADVPETSAGHMSYGAGYALGASVREQLGEDFDSHGFRAGIADALDSLEPRVSDTELDTARDEILTRREALAGSAAEANLARAQEFLEENAARDGVTVTESGLQYEILESGDGNGARPGPTARVVTHYTGRLPDGTVFDSSEARGPARFNLDQVIEGWQEALQLMQEGDRWRIWLPPELGYGARGAGDNIPPNSALVFDVELLEVGEQ